jgi:amino acid transporter
MVGYDSKKLAEGTIPLRLIVFQSFANMAPGAVVGVFMTGLAGLALGSMPLVAIGAFGIFFLTLNANYQYSKRIANAGGYYGYAGTAINKYAGFYAGMFYAMNGIVGGAAFGFLQFAVFAYFLFPTLSAIPYLWLLFMTADAVFITFITYRGIRLNLLYMTITGIAESAVLYVGALVLIAMAGHHNTLSVFTPVYLGNNYSLLFFAIIANFTSFIGAGSVITLAEEAKKPAITIKKALIYVIFIGALPIILSSYAFTVTYGPLNMGTFAGLADPGFLIYLGHLGPIFAYLFAILVLNSCLSVGVAIFNATSRTLWGMAREGLLPKSLSYVHPRFKTPSRAIITLAVVDYIIALASVKAFGVFDGFFVLAVIVAIPVMMAHLISNAGLPVLSLREKILKTGWRVFTNMVVPIAAVIIIAFAIGVSVHPLPVWPYLLAPIITVAWFIIVTIMAVVYRARLPDVFKGKPANVIEKADIEN